MSSSAAIGDSRQCGVRISRRDLIAGGIALGAMPFGSARPADNRGYDVIVIGAGLSGLYAAMLLEELGARVLVIEGRQRLGGRILTLEEAPGLPEAGANEALGGYGRVRDICQRLEVGLKDLSAGQRLNRPEIALRGRLISRSQWPQDPLNTLPTRDRAADPANLIWQIVARTNPLETVENWWRQEHAHLDIAAYHALQAEGYDEAAIALLFDTNPAYGSSARATSILQWYSLQKWFAMQAEREPVALVAEGGNIAIPRAMAESLKGDVLLGRAVASIRQDPSGVTVICEDGTRWRAAEVVCSVPFGPLRWMDFDPLLPAHWREAIQQVPQMWITQVHLAATRPYWEDDGLDPGMWTDGPAGVVTPYRNGATVDEVTSLTAWGRGFTAQYLDTLGVKDGAAAVIRAIEELRPAARGALEVLGVKSWQLDRFAGGDWAVWAPGQVTRLLHALGEPVGRLHFCGEHTARFNRGMEGALESGERAALEVAARL